MGCLRLHTESTKSTMKVVYRNPAIGLKSAQCFMSIDPLAYKYPHASPYNYVLGNQIKLTDPTGMGPEEGDFPPLDLDASITSYFNNDGCFNRTTANEAWQWTDIDGKDMGYVISEINVIANKDPLHDREANAIGNGLVNFFEIDVNKLNDPKQGTDEVLKLSGKISFIGLNIMSLGEGAAELKGASYLSKSISLFGMANVANGLINDLTGFNASEEVFGQKVTLGVTTANSSIGIIESIFNKKPSIGNIGDVKDLIFETPKLIPNDKPK